jgi:hypothetical protein
MKLRHHLLLPLSLLCLATGQAFAQKPNTHCPDTLDAALLSAELALQHLQQGCVQLGVLQEAVHTDAHKACMAQVAAALGYRYAWVRSPRNAQLLGQLKAYNGVMQSHLNTQLGPQWVADYNRRLRACTQPSQ